MKKYIKSSYSEYSDLIQDATDNLVEYIESGDAMSYDDVISETYAQVQTLFEDAYGEEIDSDLEDILFESVLDNLDFKELIDHKNGYLLFEYEE